MNKFEKLNNDIQELGKRLSDNQDLCRLIHYPQPQPFEQQPVNGKREVLHKRLLLFSPKLPLAKETGTYVSVRVPRFAPSRDGFYMASIICFDVYSHNEVREIYYYDSKGNPVRGDRPVLILSKIDEIMQDFDLGVGKSKLDRVDEISNSDARFSGYSAWYLDVDFRKRW